MVDFMNICVISFKLLELFVPGVLTGRFVGGGIRLVGTRFLVYISFLVVHRYVHIIVIRICIVQYLA